MISTSNTSLTNVHWKSRYWYRSHGKCQTLQCKMYYERTRPDERVLDVCMCVRVRAHCSVDFFRILLNQALSYLIITTSSVSGNQRVSSSLPMSSILLSKVVPLRPSSSIPPLDNSFSPVCSPVWLYVQSRNTLSSQVQCPILHKRFSRPTTSTLYFFIVSDSVYP